MSNSNSKMSKLVLLQTAFKLKMFSVVIVENYNYRANMTSMDEFLKRNEMEFMNFMFMPHPD